MGSCTVLTDFQLVGTEMNEPTKKILYIDNDEVSFQLRKCMAQALNKLPPVELYHAADATEALLMLEDLEPDVIIIDTEVEEERLLFMDSLVGAHPPVVLQTEGQTEVSPATLDGSITYIPKDETLEGIHQTLMIAATVATNHSTAGEIVYH